MHELKYRVWLPSGECLVAPSHNISLSLHVDSVSVIIWCSDGVMDEIPAVRIDRYAGFGDVEGIDVFEGDITAIPGTDYDSGDYVYGEIAYKHGRSHEVFTMPDGDVYYEDVDPEQTLVIGNTYQTPELLEGYNGRESSN